ncbi:MAG TPA: cob(I)yrinic acid a,c-diamide adenosyltransferase [Verrucomicrobiae bacterium]|nr:cob(I)yrinic acid a,c-diamide adenosyltransferase [Verrucomicrobiae bacterium]
MGHRLSKIVTRTGDAGDTGLTGGARVPKTHARVHAMGDVDELNSQLGVLLALKLPSALRETLTRIQHELFSLGGELSMPGTTLMADSMLLELEREIEGLNAKLPPLKDFVLPGGNAAAAAAHLARAICRRAERAVWAVKEGEPIDSVAARYLNRLSDLLFVMARVLARAKGSAEVQWRGSRSPSRGRR